MSVHSDDMWAPNDDFKIGSSSKWLLKFISSQRFKWFVKIGFQSWSLHDF